MWFPVAVWWSFMNGYTPALLYFLQATKVSKTLISTEHTESLVSSAQLQNVHYQSITYTCRESCIMTDICTVVPNPTQLFISYRLISREPQPTLRNTLPDSRKVWRRRWFPWVFWCSVRTANETVHQTRHRDTLHITQLMHVKSFGRHFVSCQSAFTRLVVSHSG